MWLLYSQRKFLYIVDKGVNSEFHALSKYWCFHVKSLDEAWYLFEWIAWDSFEFEKGSSVFGYSSAILLYSMLDLNVPFFV